MITFLRATAFLILCSLPLILTGCGFTPLYAQKPAHKGADIKTTLNQIEIDLIPDREGQILRNTLIDRFYDQGWPQTPRYKLHVSAIRETKRNLDVTKTSDATRAQLRLYTTLTLRDIQTGETLLKRDLHAITSYNILQSQFTTRVSENDARENALQDLAGQIETRLALYFNRAER